MAALTPVRGRAPSFDERMAAKALEFQFEAVSAQKSKSRQSSSISSDGDRDDAAGTKPLSFGLLVQAIIFGIINISKF